MRDTTIVIAAHSSEQGDDAEMDHEPTNSTEGEVLT